MRRVAIITGTGLYDVLQAAGESTPQVVHVETPYGTQTVHVHDTHDLRIFHVNRHGDHHRLPPHRLDPRRTIDALSRCGVAAILGVANTGSLRPNLGSGDLVVPHDLIDFTGHPHHTFFDEDVTHVDFSQPYCPTTRSCLLAALKKTPWEAGRVHERGVYVATRGPRFETPAETAHLARLGDVVGMTGAGEAVLARERGLCYAALAFVANPAAGVAGVQRTATEIRQALGDESERINRVLWEAARRLGERRDCACADAPGLGRLAPVGSTT